jgi:hypothetical protein
MVRDRRSSVIWATVLALWLIGGIAGMMPMVSAEEQSVDLNSPEAIRHGLEQQAGKRVKIKLTSGQDLGGKVARVGGHAVVLSEITGMELFDATVRLDQVAAILVRVRSK